MALLYLLLERRERLGIEIAVAHFNHKLRGAGSDEDEKFVSELAAAHHLEFHRASADVAAEARQKRANLEATGRRLRYAFLRGLVDSGSATKVATGHTADDQAETVVARLLRGSGTRGLAGIHPVVDGWLVRPLLRARRNRLRQFLGELGVSWREDPTNRDIRFTRNRLRADVMPLLEGINPRAVEHLSDLAQVARDEEDSWASAARAALQRISTRDGQLLKLHIPGLVQLHSALQRRILRAAVAAVAPEALGRLELHHVEALRRLALDSQSGRRVHLPGSGMEAARVFDTLELRPAGVSEAGFEYLVEVPGHCEIPRLGVRLSFILTEKPAGERGYNQEEASLVDLDSIQNPLIVRNWRPGDCFESPTGRTRRKIKKLLLERRVPAHLRTLWPVVLSGNRVIWARGFPAARPFRPSPHSRAMFLIREEVLNGSDELAGNPAL